MTTTPSTTAPTPAPAAPVKSKGPMMKLAELRIRLDKTGWDVPLVDVTPAELMLLVAEHHANAGGDPVLDLKETGEVERTATQEVERLRMKYAANKVKALFQGAIPNVPQTYDEAKKAGIGFVLPTNKLTEG